MMSPGSTVLRFDFDIFSMAPISTSSPVAISTALRFGAVALDAHFGRRQPAAVAAVAAGAIGLVDDHALGEQAIEGLVDAEVAGRRTWRGRRSANRAGAGSRARCRRYTGRPAASRRRRRGRSASAACGAVKRAKYQDESTKVSMVSVSRSARLAADRAGDMLPRRVAVERIARLVEGDVVGQQDRQVLVRHGHDAVVRAVDHGDRAAPVALARDAPVAQAIVDLALALRLRPKASLFQGVERQPPWRRQRSCRRGNPN